MELTSFSQLPEPSSIHAAMIAAEATMRLNEDVSAVFVVTPGVSGNVDLPRDVVMILRVDYPDRPVDEAAIREASHAHIPQWARTLLDSTEGVR